MSDAQKTLEKIQKQEALKGDPQDFYAKLLINKPNRRLLAISVLMAFIGTLIFVLFNMRTPHVTWSDISLPIIFIGLMLSLIPISEEWIYRPWQYSARQYEKHFRIKR